ncbi:MAG TPA: Type 1 glutamine amidotransferase-like domain-containing protein [Phototrophicaceae bacterium]|nr:Type 1 glutamine amidotransferase-like domain-containing protein [Phototrophicaceae bacterium]
MGHIIAMGGGELRDYETLPMDEQVVKATGKKQPNALFIPTASGDAEGYCATFHHVYGEKLGCQTDVLYLFQKRPTVAGIAEKIRWADCIYVGGGNTMRMVKLWRKLGVDRLLVEAHQQGTVLSGVSAGAICWFDYGHSYSRSLAAAGDNKVWVSMRMRALGLVPGIFCPHLNDTVLNSYADFMQRMRRCAEVGIGVEDNAAIEVVDDTYRIITSQVGAKAYKFVRRRGGQVEVEDLKPSDTFQPLAELLKK